MRFRVLVLILLVLLSADVCTAKKQRDIKTVKKERTDTEKALKDANKKLTDNTKQTKQTLNKLNSLSGEIKTTNQQIDKVKASVDSLNRHIKVAGDSIATLNARVRKLKADYTKAMRDMQGTSNFMDVSAYVLSAPTFSQAYSRMRYAQEFSRWSSRTLAEINRLTGRVEAHKTRLGAMQEEKSSSLNQLNTTQKKLTTQRAEADKLVKKLKKEETNLKAVLKKNEQRMKALDKELDRLIEEQQRAAEKAAQKSSQKGSNQKPATGSKDKPKTTQPTAIAEADRKLNGSFESNKGRLLFPVSGQYKIVRGFGRQKHPELEHVETENNGIDIESIGNGQARSIFEGKVSAVFRQPGFNTIVMVRHGSYLSVYANLASIQVKVGDQLKTGQTIGTIYRDPDNGNKAVLHFELRKERTKLNPTAWVK